MAHINLTGRLGGDPLYTPAEQGKKAVAKLRVAWSEKEKDKTGAYVDTRTEWVNVACFGTLAERVSSTFQTGMLVAVEGRIKPGSYFNKKTNQEVETLEITADIVAPLLFGQQVQVQKNQTQGSYGQQGFNQAPQQQGFAPQPGDDEPPF